MPSRIVATFVVLALTLGMTIGFASISSAGDHEDEPALTVKVAVQLLGDNLLEIAIDHDGDLILPERRKMVLSQTQRKRWLTSSPITIDSPAATSEAMRTAPDGVPAPEHAWATPGFGTVPVVLSVAAWVEADHSIWFAIVHDGKRVHPERRRLAREAIDNQEHHNRWLRTSPVEIDFGETPASLLRKFSAQVTVPAGMPHTNEHETLVDVAQSCSLESVAPLDADSDPAPDWSEWLEEDIAPSGYSSFRWKVTSSAGARHTSSTDALWLWRNTLVSSFWTGQPSSEYLFIVRDARPPYPMTMWAAVFDCSAVEYRETSDNDIELEAA